MSHPPIPEFPTRSDLATAALTKGAPLFEAHLHVRRYERILAQLLRHHNQACKCSNTRAGVDARDG